MEWKNIEPTKTVETDPVNLAINNGKDKITVNLDSIRDGLTKLGATPQEREKTIAKIKEYEVQVRLANNDNVHLGSSDLKQGIINEIMAALGKEGYEAGKEIEEATKSAFIRWKNEMSWKNIS